MRQIASFSHTQSGRDKRIAFSGVPLFINEDISKPFLPKTIFFFTKWKDFLQRIQPSPLSGNFFGASSWLLCQNPLGIREMLFCRARGALEFHSIMQSDWPARKQKTLRHRNRFLARVRRRYFRQNQVKAGNTSAFAGYMVLGNANISFTFQAEKNLSAHSTYYGLGCFVTFLMTFGYIWE